MVWNLRGALLKKQETESARLADFEFRLRARTMRLLAPVIDPALSPDALAGEIAVSGDDVIIAGLMERFPDKAGVIGPLYPVSRANARVQMIDEIGDPSPVRLA
jgi:hypothetical protein